MMKKIAFVTGTRADFGKMKPLMNACEKSENIELHVFVSGMHRLPQYGNTYKEVAKENYTNMALQPKHEYSAHMDVNLCWFIADFSSYVHNLEPDMIIVHGDRIDALGGAIVAMLNNILLTHIEGGEVTGTVDESIRHAISKMANIHFVSNEESRIRLKQLGEDENCIFVIGSPDIDVMLHGDLPDINIVKKRHGIWSGKYAILIQHPVVSEVETLERDMGEIISALKDSKKMYIVIFPNNDLGSEIILRKYADLEKESTNFKFYASLPFEDFLVILKNADFIVGNSSCGVREACVYGIPAIDIGTRQKNRYSLELLPNIQNIPANYSEILNAIGNIDEYRISSSYFGAGNSTKKFMDILANQKIWQTSIQKHFLDTLYTQKEIRNIYHNEVCF